MLATAAVLLLAGIATGQSSGNTFDLASPDGRIRVQVGVAEDVTRTVFVGETRVLAPSPLSMDLGGGRILGREPVVERSDTRSIRRTIRPVIRVKTAEILDHFNELTLSFKGGYGVIFRAYDDGVAYRFFTKLEEEIRVASEEVVFDFGRNHHIYFPEEKSLVTHSERIYLHVPLAEIGPDRFCSLPALVDLEKGVKVLLTEADLIDYPGLFLRGSGSPSLHGKFPGVVLECGMKGDRNPMVKRRGDHIAVTRGERSFPWRVMIITESDADLVRSQMVYKLARPLQLQDTSWIKPGKVAWDWYNANNVHGVDFRAGVNTRTYKYYIDFAAAHGIEYVILDEGWYVLGDLLKTAPDMDLPEIFRHARKKKVGLILWVVWKTLEDQLHEAMDQFRKWGAVGIKVDFMQRDDQWMVNYYERIARIAADNKMVVDFHGSYKPAGLRRAFPNVLTREGVKGLENNKWCDLITPEHNVTLPFIRMVAGPMDYTPGSMTNARKKNFKPLFTRPMSQGTRCHQLAMYVVFESPLQMLADSPSMYLREKECLEFLSAVPTVWDDTKVLDGRVGDYILLARKSGEDWYVGAMTDWTARELTLDFSFLGPGTHDIVMYRDGVNADRYGNDYRKHTGKISRRDRMKIRLAPGGGWAARIR